MMNDSAAILDDLLSRWHHHCVTYSSVPTRGATPMFRQALRAKGEQTLDAICEDQVHQFQMEAIDTAVFGDSQWQGGMEAPYSYAIQIMARNAYTGRSVWLSPRLPKDPQARATIVAEARNQLTKRLMAAGVM